jgi:hypothetical protein
VNHDMSWSQVLSLTCLITSVVIFIAVYIHEAMK